MELLGNKNDSKPLISIVLDSSRRTSQAMHPKKAKTIEKSRKKTSKKCPFNNRSYCKSKESCEDGHSEEVCNNLDCD